MASPYDKLLDMIKCLDLQDDVIRMNHKIKSIEQDFCNIIKDEQMLSESMDYMNNNVLGDNEAALKFALLFSSRNFDSLAMNDLKVRCKMLNILQTNFSNADKYRKEDKNRLYNSITLLGEYYHRVRLADGSPISILGESLLGLLTQEINMDNIDSATGSLMIDLKLAKLILSQVTLNGDVIRTTHTNEINILLFHIRKVLIEQPTLQPAIKALLLMTLDLYYSNFTSLTPPLEEMYTKYLVEEDKLNREEKTGKREPEVPIVHEDEEVDTLENGNVHDDIIDSPPVATKKWSEQVCEDSMYESEIGNDFCDSLDNSNNDETGYQSLPIQISTSLLIKEEPSELFPPISSTKSPENYKNNIRSPTPQSRSQNRPKHINNNNNNNQQHNNNNRYNQNSNRNHRNGVQYEDDRNSVRSEGGSIRLYSVEDRLRHSQSSRNSQGRDKWERGGGFHTNENGRQRSNSRNSNYENGAPRNNTGGYRNQQNNRHHYDRPPRFRNAESSWRNNMTSSTASSQDHLSTDPGSRDATNSTRSRTLPRNNRHGYFESYNGGGGGGGTGSGAGAQRSVSPDGAGRGGNANVNRVFHNDGYHNNSGNAGHFSNQNNQQHPQNRQQSRNFGRTNNQNYSNRYSSHSSLTSDSGAWERRGRTNNMRRNSRGKSHDWDEANGEPLARGNKEDNNWKNPPPPLPPVAAKNGD